MSDSSPENFMEQALALITELKKALEASFDAQNTRINESFDAQNTRINAIATDYAFLKTDFEQHKNNHVSQSTVNSAIATQSSSHNQKLQNIKTKFISIEIYDAQIKALNAEIAELKKQLKNIPQPKKPPEKAPVKPKAAEKLKPESPADLQPKILASKHTKSMSSGVIDVAAEDPHLDDLHTEILKAILESEAYQSIKSINRGRILTKANTLVGPSVNDNVLHMQVILALYYLQNKSKSIPLNLYNKCYQNNLDELKKLTDIIKPFIGNNTLIVTGNIFKDAINDSNFKTIITSSLILTSTNYDEKFIIKIQAPALPKGAN